MAHAGPFLWTEWAKEPEGKGGKYLGNCQMVRLHDPSVDPMNPQDEEWA